MGDIQIAIVTKDRPEILKDTLLRLEELSLDNKSLIIDGSRGAETKKVSQNFESDYYRQDKGRRIQARNIALEKCDSDYLAFIDDDVFVSDSWFESMKNALEKEDVVGVTGRLKGENVEFGSVSGKIRSFLFGGKAVFGEILDNGVINGDFFYDEEKEVDHLVGCNMGVDVEAIKDVGGFNTDYDVGNAYREETEPTYLLKNKGRLIYDPSASLEHLGVNENEKRRRWLFYNPYLTKYFLNRNNVVKDIKGRLGYLINKIARHCFYLLTSIKNRDLTYKYYLLGELKGFNDFIIKDKKPQEHL